MSASLHVVDPPSTEGPQVAAGPGTGSGQAVFATEAGLETGTVTAAKAAAGTSTESQSTAGTVGGDSKPGTSIPGTGPFQGDGADPSQAAILIPQRSTLDWVAYTVSLNYNRVRQLDVLR